MLNTPLSPSLPSPAYYRLPLPVIDMIGEYFQSDLQPDQSDLQPGHPSPDHLHYKQYRHTSILLELHRAINGEIPASLKNIESMIHRIRLRTAQLEDVMIVKCFLKYCYIHPLSQKEVFYAQLPLCLRGEGAPLCPLLARVDRFLRCTASSPALHAHFISNNPSSFQSENPFLNASPFEPLHALVCSIQKTYISRQTVQRDAQENLRHSVNSLYPSPTLRQRIKHILSYTLTVGCILIFTVVKIALFMISTIAACAFAAPFVITFGNIRHNCDHNFTNWLELKYYLFFCVGIGAVGGFGYGVYQTFPYLRELWRERHSIVQLHQESLPAFKRLWTDYTRAHGTIKGTCKLFSTLFATGGAG